MNILPCDGKLSLINDGALELFFIGTGSAFSHSYYQTNFLLIKGNTHILVDFGMTGPVALAATAGLAATDIETLLPTHSHCDHIGGVEYLALMNRYVGMKFRHKPKMKVIINEEYQQVLWEMSLRGGLEWNEGAQQGHRPGFSDFFDVVRPVLKTTHPREIWQLDYNGLHIELFRTNHIPDLAPTVEQAFMSYGLFVEDRIFISGDTKFDRDLIDIYADRSEYMFHDAQLSPNPVHASYPDLQTLPSDIKKKMFLMHYPDGAEHHTIPDFAGWAQQGVRYIFV